MSKVIYDKVIFATATNSKTNKVTVYLKYSTADNKYAVKIMNKNEKITELETYSLSAAMYKTADLIAHYTDGLTSWESLPVT